MFIGKKTYSQQQQQQPSSESTSSLPPVATGKHKKFFNNNNKSNAPTSTTSLLSNVISSSSNDLNTATTTTLSNKNKKSSSTSGVELNAMYISTHCTEPSFDQIKKLKLSNHGITYCEDLSFLQFVQRIELDNNQLSSIDFMRDNNDANYVNVSHNQISDLTPLKNMRLQVLNASHNQLESLSSECFKSSVNSLKALIVSNNQLSSLPDLKFVDLNTLVISHNEIKNIDVIAKCEQLKKISASNNQIRLLPEGIKRCVALEELRLSHNKLVSLPNAISNNVNLKIVNLSHNMLTSFEDIKKLSMCKRLRDLTLADNPIAKKEDYKEQILNILPQLELLDGELIRPGLNPKRAKKINDRKTKKEYERSYEENAEEERPAQTKSKSVASNSTRKNDAAVKAEPKKRKTEQPAEQPKPKKIKFDTSVKKEQSNDKIEDNIEKDEEPEFIVERFIDIEREKKLAEKMEQERLKIAQEMEIVNIKELNEQKRLLKEKNGGYAESDDKFSGVTKVITKQKKKNQKADVLDFLLTNNEDDEQVSGWD